MLKGGSYIGKADLVRLSSKKCKLSQGTVSTVLEALLDSIEETIASGNNIMIKGFVSISIKKHPARIKFLPHKGHVTIGEKTVIKMKNLIKTTREG